MEDLVKIADSASVARRWEPSPGFWRDRPVFITGATGFLGSHLTRIVAGLGSQLVILVRDQVPANPVIASWVGAVTQVSGDVRDQALLERILGEYEIATVFHLAAQTIVGVANRNPVSTFDSNIGGTWAVLEAVRRSPLVKQVVVASSDKAYGSQPSLPYTEDMPLLAVHPYDVSKACTDMLTFSYRQVFDVPASVTRCGNFFGPGDNNWNRLVPGTIRTLLRGDRPVIRSDGTPIRDYLFVEDGALAYMQLAEAMATDPDTVGEAFNFSTETQLPVLDLVRQIGIAVGRPDLEPTVLGAAEHEIPHQFLSAKKAASVLGWRPRYSIDEALAITVAWYRSLLAAGDIRLSDEDSGRSMP